MGLIHIYCGDGKGKTTAALGLALRAAGSGMNVHIVQFLKGTPTSELEALKNIPNITVERCDRNYGFTFSMSEEAKQEITKCHDRLLKRAVMLAESGQIGLLILDEFNAAYRQGLLDREAARSFVLNKPEALELVLTGRNPDAVFVEAADYVSEICGIKHPYKKKIAARRGIEF